MIEYTRKCPKCPKIIKYNRNSDKLRANRANSSCKSCMVSSGKFKKGQISNTKSIYNCWLDRYGKDIADKKWKSFLEKQSFNNRGIKNSMYSKPSPVGSGNGWSGWYKGWYFRSILELSYMVNIIEKFNLKWENAESKKLTIPYTIDNINRTYRADFLINNKYLIDCKPKKLHNSYQNTFKKEAAIKFCNERGYIFKFSQIPKLSTEKIINLYKNKEIKFLERYENKFKQRYAALL